jgi:hypothetical protein
MVQAQLVILVLFYDPAERIYPLQPATWTRNRASTMADVISGNKMPIAASLHATAEPVRQHASKMLFNCLVRVFVFSAMKGIRQNLKFDDERLYISALFHDLHDAPWSG